MSLRFGILIIMAGAMTAAGCDVFSPDPVVATSPDPATGPGMSSVADAEMGREIYTNQEGNYRVEFPGTPKVEETTQVYPAGSLTFHLATVVLPAGTCFTASYTDYPPRVAQEPPSLILEAVASAPPETWEIRDRQPVSLDGHPGFELEFVMTIPGGIKGLGKTRMILVGPRLFQLIAVGPEGSYDEAAGDRFLESFALLNPVEITPSGGPKPTTTFPKATSARSPRPSQAAKNVGC